MEGSRHQRKSIASINSNPKQEKYFSDEDEYEVAYERELDLLRRRHNARRRPAIIKRVKPIKSNSKLLLNVGQVIDKADERTEVGVKDDKPQILKEESSGDCWTLTSAAKKEILTEEVALTGISQTFKYSIAHKKGDVFGNQLNKVASLHLQKKGIQTMTPDAFKSFHSLAHLYLYDNKIKKLEGLQCLPQLESLHLSGNKISRIENLQNLFNLRQLYLGNNEIEIVEGIENLGMLVELHIEYQKLPPKQSLIFCPNSLDTISRKLKVLNIKGNQLENIDDLMCMDVLDTLDLSRNKINDLDHVSIILRTLRHLRILDLRENLICKNPKYKEKIVGFCGGIEVLDGKDVNDIQRKCLQRLCSIKAMRLRNQVNRDRQQNSFPSSNFQSQNSMYPEPQLHDQMRQVVSLGIMKPLSVAVPSDINNDQFQFSTPISASPSHEQQASYYENLMQAGDGQETEENNLDSSVIKKEIEELYASRAPGIQLEGSDSEKMSEMAKIIFRLSNLSPSGSGVEKPRESPPSYYWNSAQGQGRSSNFKESRPLSPLEVDVTNPNLTPSFTVGTGGGSRRTVTGTVRRPMAKKLPPRQAHGAGRTLSPLEELPTPDSTREKEGSDWRGQSFQTSMCQLPPWPHISRKKGVAPPKVVFMP